MRRDAAITVTAVSGVFPQHFTCGGNFFLRFRDQVGVNCQHLDTYDCQ